MDRQPAPLQLLIGIAVGFIARPFIMGCFQSKPEPLVTSDIDSKPAASRISVSAAPESTMKVPTIPPLQQQKQQQPVIQVVRPGVSVGARERAELKVKTLRDRLQSTMLASERQMIDEGRLAIQMKNEGKLASAKLIILNRRYLKSRIAKCETSLKMALEMIESIEDAQRNEQFVKAIEDGNQLINEIMKDISPERVQNALDDKNAAKEYTDEMNLIFQQDGLQQDIADDQLEEELANIESQLQSEHTSSQQVDDTQQKISQVPEAPTDVPVQANVEHIKVVDNSESTPVAI